MKTNYTIEFYDPMTSHWWVAGKLIFLPDDYLAERIAEEGAKEMCTSYDKVRILNNRITVKQIEL